MDGLFAAPEQQALLAGLRGQPLGLEVDWTRLLELSRLHLVDALLYEAWNANAEVVPSAGLAALAREYRDNAIRGTAGSWQCLEVIQMLHDGDIPCLVLKGAALAAVWYGDLARRSFRDIDILVPPDRLADARRALLTHGYTDSQHTVSDGHQHLPPLVHPTLPCAVELHARPSHFPVNGWPDFAVLAERAISVPSAVGGWIPTLGPEDTLVQLCLHLLSHTWDRGGWRLGHVCDLSRHLSAFVIDWDLAEALARDVGALSACRAVLTLTASLLDAAVPPGMIDHQAAAGLQRYPAPCRRLDDTPYRRLYGALARPFGRRQPPSPVRSAAPGHRPLMRSLAYDLRRSRDFISAFFRQPRAAARRLRENVTAERQLLRTRMMVTALLDDRE